MPIVNPLRKTVVKCIFGDLSLSCSKYSRTCSFSSPALEALKARKIAFSVSYVNAKDMCSLSAVSTTLCA